MEILKLTSCKQHMSRIEEVVHEIDLDKTRGFILEWHRDRWKVTHVTTIRIYEEHFISEKLNHWLKESEVSRIINSSSAILDIQNPNLEGNFNEALQSLMNRYRK